MKNVFIYNPHSAYSPGGVWKGRTEYGDICAFSEELAEELKKYKDINCVMYSRENYPFVTENDVLLSFHRASAMKNCDSCGADALCKSESSAAVQYKAYRLLDSLCGENGFRFKGVHTFTRHSPLRSIEKSGSPLSFIFTLGYMDNVRDNGIFDCFSDELIKNFAYTLNEIIKENENEVRTSFSQASFG